MQILLKLRYCVHLEVALLINFCKIFFEVYIFFNKKWNNYRIRIWNKVLEYIIPLFCNCTFSLLRFINSRLPLGDLAPLLISIKSSNSNNPKILKVLKYGNKYPLKCIACENFHANDRRQKRMLWFEKAHIHWCSMANMT